MPLISWPETVPLPFVNFTGAPRNATIGSGPDRGQIWRRCRFKRSFTSISVTWILKPAEYHLFETFVNTSLHNGARRFLVELRYPLNSGLNTWDVRLAGGFEGTWLDGAWGVTAVLDLIRKTE